MTDENQPLSTSAPSEHPSDVARGQGEGQSASWWVLRYGSYRVVALDLVLAVVIQMSYSPSR